MQFSMRISTAVKTTAVITAIAKDIVMAVLKERGPVIFLHSTKTAELLPELLPEMLREILTGMLNEVLPDLLPDLLP